MAPTLVYPKACVVLFGKMWEGRGACHYLDSSGGPVLLNKEDKGFVLFFPWYLDSSYLFKRLEICPENTYSGKHVRCHSNPNPTFSH